MSFLILIIFYILCFFPQPNLSTDDIDCYPWEKDPKVCKCNATHCDNTTKIDWCPEKDVILIYTTSDYGARIRRSSANFSGPSPDSQFTLRIDPCTTYQKYFGFGGALTDSSAIMISCLPESAKIFLMNNYFNCDVGLGYNVIRVNLGACDFSPEFYTYCDSTTSTCSSDPNLSCFNLHYYDTHFKIPLLKLAINISCRCITIKGATWNAPEWMTTPKVVSTDDIKSYLPVEFQGLISPFVTKKFLREDCFEAWSNYYIKTIEAFGFCELNCSFILSAGNEPFVALVSLGFTPQSYKTFLTDYLCPKIRKLNCSYPIKILVNDDQTPFLELIQLLLADPSFESCVDIVGTHWYLDFQNQRPILELARQQHETFSKKNPGKDLWRTESTIAKNTDGTYYQSDWEKLVKYLIDIITLFKGGITVYLDWNIVLDLYGGPNWQNNPCFAAIQVDCEKGEFYKHILFYGLGHFSKFLIPGLTIRIKIDYEEKNPLLLLQDSLYYVAFKVSVPDCERPNIVVIILNTKDSDIKGDICIDYDCATITVPAKSVISTVSTLPCEFSCN